MTIEAMKLALEALNKLTDAAEGFSVSGVYFNEGVWEKECLNTSYAAIKALEEALAKQEQGEPVAFKIYKPTPPRGAIPNVRDAGLPWVYDQDPSSGNVASMWVTPVATLPIEAAHSIKEKNT